MQTALISYAMAVAGSALDAAPVPLDVSALMAIGEKERFNRCQRWA